MCLDGFWNFQAEQTADDSEDWSHALSDPVQLAVPGSWNEQREDLFKFFGPGWYQRRVHVPAEWKAQALWLRVGAAHYKTRAWLNGVLLGDYEGGSLPSEYDATEAAKFGEDNVLTICVDGSLDPWGLPPAKEGADSREERVGFFNQDPPVTYDFFPFAGIHRSVWFYTTSRNRIEDITVTTVLTEKQDEATVQVNAQVTDPEAVEKLSALIEGETFELHRDREAGLFRGELPMTNPRLWDVGQPELYEVTLRLENADRSTDRFCQTFGIRDVRVDEKGLRLNGRHVYLTGFGKHEDSDFYGRGYNPALVVRDYEMLRWVGANSFRTAHYPYAEEIYDMADRQGVLVIGETPFVGMNERMFTPEIEAKALPMIERMIARDKNHPSVVAWSLANEPYIKTDAALAFFQAMARTARRCDSTRPITYVGHVEVADNRAAPDYDFFCLNKYYGWYVGHGNIDATLEGLSNKLDEFYQAFGKPMMITEFGADAVPGMHSWPAQPFSEEFQAEIVEKQWEVIRRKDYIFGVHLWNFADFKTSQTLSRIIHNRKGAFTRDRTPKLVAHSLRRLWKDLA